MSNSVDSIPDFFKSMNWDNKNIKNHPSKILNRLKFNTKYDWKENNSEIVNFYENKMKINKNFHPKEFKYNHLASSLDSERIKTNSCKNFKKLRSNSTESITNYDKTYNNGPIKNIIYPKQQGKSRNL